MEAIASKNFMAKTAIKMLISPSCILPMFQARPVCGPPIINPYEDPPYRKMGCKIPMIWGLLAVDGAFSWSQRTCSLKMCEIHEKSYKRKMCQTLPPPKKKTLNLTLSEAIFPTFSIGGCGDSFKPVTTGVRPWLPVNWSATSIDV